MKEVRREEQYSFDKLYIGGEWVFPRYAGCVEVSSPATKRVVGHTPLAHVEDVDDAVDAARTALESGPWPGMSIAERAEILARVAAGLTGRLDALIEAQIDEMGGTRRFLGPVTRTAVEWFDSLSEIARAIPMSEVRTGRVGPVVVNRKPVGVVAAITAWNSPISLLASKVVPALLMGCPIVVKPAIESSLSCFLFAEAIHSAGLPAGVFNLVIGDAEVGERLVANENVDKVTFTGSTQVGSRIASLCGAQFKNVTLECGGKSAGIVLADADLNDCMPSIVDSCLGNSGQLCFATTRLLIPSHMIADVSERFKRELENMRIGDPHDEEVYFGPVVSERQLSRIEGYIRLAIEEGARVVTGGKRLTNMPGWFIEPTVLTGVSLKSRVMTEEIFGPVVVLVPYDDEDEAVDIANDSEYGLGGAVFSQDIGRALIIASRIFTGTCRINEAPAGGGGGPFGGVKKSGMGRERDIEGFSSFLELQSISLPGCDVDSKQAINKESFR